MGQLLADVLQVSIFQKVVNSTIFHVPPRFFRPPWCEELIT